MATLILATRSSSLVSGTNDEVPSSGDEQTGCAISSPVRAINRGFCAIRARWVRRLGRGRGLWGTRRLLLPFEFTEPQAKKCCYRRLLGAHPSDIVG